MDRLLRDLVDAATIAAGGLSIAVAPVDPAELVRTAVDLAEPLAREKGIALSAEIRDALPGVACDRDRVLQVLSNLLGNAIQMTPEGGAVVARAERGEGDVRFAVSDTGPGIEPADLPRVFERYWRGQHARHGGRGLGLAIAKGIIDAHRGRIGAESTVGAGSTFWFALPPCEKAS